MKKISRYLLIIIALLLVCVLSSCDGKKPDKGYVTREYIVDNVIKNIDTSVKYRAYSYQGHLNYVGLKNESIINDPSGTKKLVDNDLISLDDNTSFFLRLPLHITPANWEVSIQNAQFGVDRSSGELAYYPEGTVLKADGKNWSDHPTERLYLVVDKEGKICYQVWKPTKDTGDITEAYYHSFYTVENNPAYVKTENSFKVVVPEGGFAILLRGAKFENIVMALSNNVITKDIVKDKEQLMELLNSKNCPYDEEARVIYDKKAKNIIVTNYKEGPYTISLSTNYRLESRIYKSAGEYTHMDKPYYYIREGGGFIVKVFGVNKQMTITAGTEIRAYGKWNVTVEYDENGYLLSETFETLNAHKDPDEKTIYGKATYTYN